MPSARGLQLGRELVQRGISHNLDNWPQVGIRINAQAYLQDFYSELGFVASGETYDEDGICTAKCSTGRLKLPAAE